ncbi:MAG: response regulator [Candidatus Paceibacterota bacterium]|jgi:CheY-like chemotaxis protein
MTEPEKKYKIIIVDDDDFLINMYSTKFGNSGVLVDACKSGQALLEKLSAGAKADLILLDIIMPNLSGVETLKMMRKQKIGADIPVMVLTNQNDEKDIEETKKLGVVGYVVKAAATPTEVLEEVMKIIKK